MKIFDLIPPSASEFGLNRRDRIDLGISVFWAFRGGSWFENEWWTNDDDGDNDDKDDTKSNTKSDFKS